MSNVARLDARERSLIGQFQARTTQKAEELIARGLPLQILRLAALVDDAHCARAAESVAQAIDNSEPPCKKRKRESDTGSPLAHGEEPGPVPVRMLLRETESVLKREIEDFSTSLDKLKIWLSLPSNPTVSLLHSDALSEVHRAQECVVTMRSSLFTSQLERLKLSSSLALTVSASCSGSSEIATLLDAFDENQLFVQRQCLSDLLSFHIVLVDSLQKYHDQVTGAGARSSIAVFS